MLYVGWTIGSKGVVPPSYFKIYHNGIIKYIVRGTIRNYTSAKFAIDNHINYMVDMGRGNKKEIIKDGRQYTVSNINAIRIYPARDVYIEGSELSILWRISKDFVIRINTNDYQIGDNWESYNHTDIFSIIPGFSIYPELHGQEVIAGDTNYHFSLFVFPNIFSGPGSSNIFDGNDGIVLVMNLKTYTTINENEERP